MKKDEDDSDLKTEHNCDEYEHAGLADKVDTEVDGTPHGSLHEMERQMLTASARRATAAKSKPVKPRPSNVGLSDDDSDAPPY